MIAAHLTAHLRSGKLDLCVGGRAGKLWRYLRNAFPFALAVVLMPTHLHVVALVLDAHAAWQRLHRAIGAHARGLGRTVWSPVPPPKLIPTPDKLARDIRYVNLNPCRKRLAADPLEWMYSTHRDVVGAVVDPWVTQEDLAAALGELWFGNLVRHHRYVSSDPSVRVGGTELPRPEPPRDVARRTLWDVALATCAAHRCPTTEIRRSGPIRQEFLALSMQQGWRDASAIQPVLGASIKTIQRAMQHCAMPSKAASLCMGDERLLVGVEPFSTDPDCPLIDPRDGPPRPHTPSSPG